MINTVLVLYPSEFNCQSKLTRKLTNITKNMTAYDLVATSDPKGLLKNYAQDLDVGFMLSDQKALASIRFTHAVVFDDGESFFQEISTIHEMEKPLRLIKTAVTRVINIKNEPDYSHIKSHTQCMKTWKIVLKTLERRLSVCLNTISIMTSF
jgi:hypothetical protein